MKGCSRVATLRILLTATTMLSLAPPALAQESKQPEGQAGQAAGTGTDVAAPSVEPPQTERGESELEEVVVTANRRLENLQRVPIAVTQISANTADRLQIDDPQEVTQLVPGFTFQRQASGSVPFVRGVGSTSSFIGNEPSVALFIDDVYLPNGNAAIFEFNNIDSIEVLKGPQGTLFGRNATGGVLQIRTRLPSFEPTMNVEVGYGNYDTVTTKAYVSGGLSDKAALSLAAFRVYQGEGWGRNVVFGDDVNDNRSWGVRGKLLFKPTDTTEILLGGTYNQRRSDIGIAMRIVPGYFGFGGSSADALGAGFYDAANSSIEDYYDTQFWQTSGKITQKIGGVNLVSITAYSETLTNFSFDLDAAPPDILNNITDNNGKTFTQELQLVSDGDKRLDWIVGGFFLKDTTIFDLTAFGLGVTSRFGPGSTQRQFSRQETTSYSVFGQANYEISPAVSITAGLRYTSDKRTESDGGSSIISGAGATLVQAGPFGSSTTFNKLTWRLALDYKLTTDILTYASYNRGFKSGGYNLPGYSPASTSPLPPVEPEVLDAYAVGFKSELFDRLLRLNVEGFWYDYKNIQVQNIVPPPNAGTILTNAGAAEIKGVDGELTIVPLQRLQIIANASYIDGRYTSFPQGPTFFPLPPNQQIAIPSGCAFTAYPTGAPGTTTAQRFCDLSGNRTVNTPPFSAAVTALYSLPTSFGDFDFSGSWTHGGNFFSEPDNGTFTRQAPYDLFNASVRWKARDGGLSVRLWANNITKEQYYAYVANSGTSGPKYAAAAPRTYGVALGFSF